MTISGKLADKVAKVVDDRSEGQQEFMDLAANHPKKKAREDAHRNWRIWKNSTDPGQLTVTSMTVP